MAKTNFLPGDKALGLKGTKVTAAFLNAINNHVHDGVDADGHAPILDSSNIAGGYIPVGTVIHVATAGAPVGWLPADGSAVSRATYAALFAAIGSIYGNGNGATTFNLPDLRGEFIRGLDSGRGVDVGRAIGTSQPEDFKSHTHVQTINSVDHADFTSATFGAYASGSTAYAGGTIAGPATAGAGGAETRPRNVALLACIKY